VEEIENNQVWDAKKIFAVLLIVTIFALSFKTFVLDKKSSKILNSKSTNVQGVNTQENPTSSPSQVSSEDLKRNVENRLSDLKKEVNNINVVEIATSTPAVKKIINDIKNLQNLPQTQAKDICLKICQGL